MKIIKTTMTGILFLLCSGLYSEAQSWKLVDIKYSINIYENTSPAEGNYDYKAASRLRQPIDLVQKVITDVTKYPKWVEYIAESRIVKKMDDDNFYVYQRYDFTWPTEDRDVVFKVKVIRDYKSGIIRTRMTAEGSELVSKKKSCIRIAKMRGEITLKYVERNITEGTFVQSFDPGGKMPKYLESKISKSVPYVLLSELRKTCREKKKMFVVDNARIQAEIEKVRKTPKRKG